MPPDAAALRAHAAALRDRLAELDAQAAALRDDLRKVEAMLRQPRGTIDLDRVLLAIEDDRKYRQAEAIRDALVNDIADLIDPTP